MKKIVTALTLIVLACGVTHGQDEPAPGIEHLKCFGPFIGNWRYEGPLKESLEGIAEKETKMVVQVSMKRILNGAAVEGSWSIEFEGGAKLAGKSLNGWNAEKKEIVRGGMGSAGGLILGTVTPDKAAKSLTITLRGVDGKGEETSSTIVFTKTGKDTYTWQALERTGGLAEGQSPDYTFKRVKREKKAAK
jgi:hypothetical protein